MEEGVPASHEHPSDHCCYLLRSRLNGRTYIGYTTDPLRRLRQHNGEICGGAKKTSRSRPWELVCVVRGFPDQGSALRFEWRWQHTAAKKWTLASRLRSLETVLARGDGVLPWPRLVVERLLLDSTSPVENQA